MFQTKKVAFCIKLARAVETFATVLHIACYMSSRVTSVRGVLSVVAGQFLWLNVYRMTLGHVSCQFTLPLGTRRNRGNLFSLARLSSHTETVFVLFDCTAPLGFSYLAVTISPFSSFIFLALLVVATVFTTFPSSSCVSFFIPQPPSLFLSPHPSCLTLTVTQGCGRGLAAPCICLLCCRVCC